jgi:hypothetical protein
MDVGNFDIATDYQFTSGGQKNRGKGPRSDRPRQGAHPFPNPRAYVTQN